MERTLNFIDKNSNQRTLILSIIISIISMAMIGILAQSMVYNVYGDFTIPDLRFGYSFDQIQTAFDGLGGEGLRTWALAHSPDYIFPLAYSLAMMIGITLELRKLEIQDKRFKMMIFIPLAGGIADYIENILILSQVYSYPTLSESIILIASGVTILKWIILSVGFITMFSLLMLILIRKMKK